MIFKAFLRILSERVIFKQGSYRPDASSRLAVWYGVKTYKRGGFTPYINKFNKLISSISAMIGPDVFYST